jgi:putative N-acetylmannosamine-6-phosphate epimerase
MAESCAVRLDLAPVAAFAVKFNFTGFDSLEHIEKETTVDIIGIVKQAGARPFF